MRDGIPGWRSIRKALKRNGLIIAASELPQAVGGGDISAAWQVETSDGRIFLKTGSRQSADMFQAECDGLGELRRAEAIRVPQVLACDSTRAGSFLALEWLNLERPDAACERLLGRQLALLHRHTTGSFGWKRDNTIGSTPQPNGWRDEWLDFFSEQRLLHQLRLAAKKGFGSELLADGERLASNLKQITGNHQPDASLLHGDLWGGNFSAIDGQPVIYDPAVYYGDRETDLAMTRLFGGFGQDFYDSYEENWPLDPGYRRREPLYQLYHVLNHLNLFGRSYLGKSQSLIGGLLELTTGN